MALIYRSIDLHLQNSSPELLTVESCALHPGVWVDEREPKWGDNILPQSCISWASASYVLGVGIRGNLRLASTKGRLVINWSMEWVGPPLIEYRLVDCDDEKALMLDVRIIADDPPYPICHLTIRSLSTPGVKPLLLIESLEL